MTTAYHMVHYRRFELSGGSTDGQQLEVLCRKALDSKDKQGTPLWERAQERVFQLGDDLGGQVVLNRVADLSSSVFGELCYIERKGLQALLQLQSSKQKLSELTVAEVFDLEERQAPQGSNFIRGLAYWMTIGDHLLFVRTHSLRPGDIHAYLHWLLKDRSKVIESDVTFDLRAEFDKSVGDVGDI